jgi:hypothetical protein
MRAIAASLVGAVLVTAATAAGPARPDLVESSVVAAKSKVVAGTRLGLSETVANRGNARSPASSTALYLSRDRVRDGGDRLLARRAVRGLAAGGRSKGSKPVSIPATARGAYRIVACADQRRAIREKNERNNCRATKVFTVTSGEATPPAFAGLQSATTCLPGPVGGDRSSRYRLTWPAATDDVTPQSAIVYDVYRATEPGGQSFAEPTYTSQPGATSFSTPPLSSRSGWYFVVRARDAAGNRDANRVERQGMNLCL